MSETNSPTPNRSTPSSTPETRPRAPETLPAESERPAPDPTRYGDWEKNGRCIDF